MNFILSEYNTKIQTLLNRIICDVDSFDMTGRAAELKERLNQLMVEREKVKVVFVGEYAAGKSSITKMLTGDESIGIAADITTDKATTYSWNGIDIIDTPGIKTGVREKHDIITKQAISEADMLIFVITSQLFDDTIANFFHDIAYNQNKSDSIILVVNKMNKTGKGNVKEQQEILRRDLERIISPKKTVDFYTSFIDASDFLSSKEETDIETKEFYIKSSGEREFIANLNRFIKEKSLISKLSRPLHACIDILDDIMKINEEIIIPDNKEVIEDKENIEIAQNRILDEINECANDTANEIKEIGIKLKGKIVKTVSKADIDNFENEAQDEVYKLIEEKGKYIHDRIDEIGKLCNIDIMNELTSVSINHDEESLKLKDVKSGVGFEDYIQEYGKQAGNALGQAGEQLTKMGAERAAATFGKVGKDLGFNNVFSRFLNKGIINQELIRQRNIGNVLEAAGTGVAVAGNLILPLVNIALIINEEKNNKKQEEIFNKAQEKVRNTYYDYAKVIKRQIILIGKAVENTLANRVKEKEELLTNNQRLKDKNELSIERINSYRDDVTSLIEEISKNIDKLE